MWALTCLYFHPSVTINNIHLNIGNSLYFVTKGKSKQKVTAALFSAYIYHTHIHTYTHSHSKFRWKIRQKTLNSLKEFLTVNQRCYEIKISIHTQFSLNLKIKYWKTLGRKCSRWHSKKILSSPPPTGTRKLQLFTEYLSMRTTLRLAEKISYN